MNPFPAVTFILTVPGISSGYSNAVIAFADSVTASICGIEPGGVFTV